MPSWNKKILLGLCLAFSLLALTGMSKKPMGEGKVASFFKSLFAPFSRGFNTMGCSQCTANRTRYETPELGSNAPQWHYAPGGASYTEYTMAAIKKEGLGQLNPIDGQHYCPNWNKLSVAQREQFWLQFASKLAEIESGFETNLSFRETRGASTGDMSIGLFQMSKGNCPWLRTHDDCRDPKKNIDCAINRMKSIVSNNGYIGSDYNKGLGVMWQPINDHPKHYVNQTKANKAAILRYTRNLPVCTGKPAVPLKEEQAAERAAAEAAAKKAAADKAAADKAAADKAAADKAAADKAAAEKAAQEKENAVKENN
ncbi:transglycosylase SLT domain-containing protein [Bdellovibrio reynosensis]|uniref:Transglycosylase SLT domain-containing protein n=1 Tax=Bdellovibrio reynosensis TaxID=2835041 RepID=A0ABY4CB49_9BACT|nr:transglycosylase SLT domain-containing protein [Bdellovibrio reynosensis]UOF00901.1 transglycosylase SLT domain-containing protein [Bdellovibrio reynosensis]